MADIAALMANIDFCMLQPHTVDGQIPVRPMNNNGEVEDNGTTLFFTWSRSRMADGDGQDHSTVSPV